ncbi:33295_t:CDS:2, partial [Gigaspora margarita]
MSGHTRSIVINNISGVERPNRRSTSTVKWNLRNLLPDSDKKKKVVNGFLKNSSKLNQKKTLYEKKITCLHNKENESGETTKYKDHCDEDKRKEGYNVKRSRSRDRDKSTWKEIGTQLLLKVAKGEQKNQLAVENWLPLQRSQKQREKE